MAEVDAMVQQKTPSQPLCSNPLAAGWFGHDGASVGRTGVHGVDGSWCLDRYGCANATSAHARAMELDLAPNPLPRTAQLLRRSVLFCTAPRSH